MIVKVAVSVASCSSDKVYVKVSVKVSLASKPDILSLAAYVYDPSAPIVRVP